MRHEFDGVTSKAKRLLLHCCLSFGENLARRQPHFSTGIHQQMSPNVLHLICIQLGAFEIGLTQIQMMN